MGDNKGSVVDFIHVHVVEPTSLSIQEAGPATKTVGAVIGVQATLEAASTPLGGDYKCQWTVSDPNVAQIEGPSSVTNSAQVKLVGWGIAGVTASCLGLSSSVTWLVMANLDASTTDGDVSDADSGDVADD